MDCIHFGFDCFQFLEKRTRYSIGNFRSLCPCQFGFSRRYLNDIDILITFIVSGKQTPTTEQNPRTKNSSNGSSREKKLKNMKSNNLKSVISYQTDHFIHPFELGIKGIPMPNFLTSSELIINFILTHLNPYFKRYLVTPIFQTTTPLRCITK